MILFRMGYGHCPPDRYNRTEAVIHGFYQGLSASISGIKYSDWSCGRKHGYDLIKCEKIIVIDLTLLAGVRANDNFILLR